MAEFPYTTEQVQAFATAALTRPTGVDDEWGRMILRRLHGAGIKVEFPEPTYYVGESAYFPTRPTEFRVLKRHAGGVQWIASFGDNHPDARCAAQAEADRLNAEVS